MKEHNAARNFPDSTFLPHVQRNCLAPSCPTWRETCRLLLALQSLMRLPQNSLMTVRLPHSMKEVRHRLLSLPKQR